MEHKYDKQALKKSMEYARQNENRIFYSSQVISEVEREDNSLSLFYSDFVHDENNYLVIYIKDSLSDITPISKYVHFSVNRYYRVHKSFQCK